jgi:hypothetical protein
VGVGRMLRLYDMGRKKLLRKCENKVNDMNVVLLALKAVVLVVVVVLVAAAAAVVVGVGVKLGSRLWYGLVPKLVETSPEGKVAILWNQMQTDRAIPNSKPDITIHDERGVCMLMLQFQATEMLSRKKLSKSLKYRPYNRHIVYVECKNQSDTNNNRGKWNHFRTIQKVSEQHTVKTHNQGTVIFGTAHMLWKVLM